MAWPLSAAITGLRNSKAAGSIGDAENAPPSTGASKGDMLPEKSAPTQNARPAPVSTMARTSSSPSHSRYASLNCRAHVGGVGVEMVGAIEREHRHAAADVDRHVDAHRDAPYSDSWNSTISATASTASLSAASRSAADGAESTA